MFVAGKIISKRSGCSIEQQCTFGEDLMGYYAVRFDNTFIHHYKTLVLQVLNVTLPVLILFNQKTTLSDMASNSGQSVVRIGA